MRTRVATFLRGSVIAGAPLAMIVVPVALVALPLVLACRPSAPMPNGDSLGTFLVHGVLEESGCAPGLEPIDPLEFRVELTRTGRALTWRMPSGQPVSGSVTSDGEFHVRTMSQIQAWPADPETGTPGCTISQVETVDGMLVLPPDVSDGAIQAELDAGAALDVSFEATNRIEIVPVSGSDCSALLQVNGGGFPSLPCGARYQLEGALDTAAE
ncbi:MAG: hypothetical protein M3Y87_29460 [Myxococcota bacterium]|nr:hypothetical protein [Myxococcota bacterium]